MRRADRLFDIIRILRAGKTALTAAELAARLEVAPRTVYRDIATLQARQVPIEGEAGVGYVLRPGFDLPPLMFTADEIEAIVVGARLTRRTGDAGLQAAAESVLEKVSGVLPEASRDQLDPAPFYVDGHGVSAPEAVDMTEVRGAVRARRKMLIDYRDAKGARSLRTIWPLAVAYFIEVALIYAWCELRGDYRHFRADRITAVKYLDETYAKQGGRLVTEWSAEFQATRS